MKTKLEESLEKIDLLTEERDNLKDRYDDAKVEIGKLKEKIDDLKFKKESNEKISENDKVGILKKEN